MTQTRDPSAIRYGVVFSGNFPLQRTLQGATLADDLGFDTCWLGEDWGATSPRSSRMGVRSSWIVSRGSPSSSAWAC